jgi:hypothetical protein
VEKDGKVINKVWHYDSFASKFCFFQNNKFFFIFDSYVSELLFEFKNKFKDKYEEKFGKDFKDFTKEGLRNYDTFYIAINQFITFFGLQSQGELPLLTNREIDIYLWDYGKKIIKDKKEIRDRKKKSETE